MRESPCNVSISFVNLIRKSLAASLGALLCTFPAVGQDEEKPPIPEDLLADAHVREELAINEFTAPSIAKIFESLEALAPLPILKFQRDAAKQMPLNRADLAVELGFLIADGFLVVQAGELGKVEPLAAELTRYGKALGAGERVNRHAASLLESARKQEIAQLKKELAATQKDVELELVTLRDADLAHLISLGGWIRALEVSSAAVEGQFSPERAKHVMREDIADYYSAVVGGLEPRIADRPSFLNMRDILAGLRTEMTLGEEPVAQETIADIAKQATQLAELALQRDEEP
ncbi:MAG: hypothetical protein EAZ65_06885 [Verrucomicrobia bacterium]|nr:MAG: hypothetical protein EAZ84_07205 [Verrucomicrobiota bacterium]TAE87334.1 MAG: hypothetical protein EAZ82_07865 [Verrucomicrobiota bacterium]TAF25189.1 MAG: hypothetical protein EAZ71_08090 [Verrucomicrobiota bacterium]TAF40834.1 MAG: hypothetical protein EAZ65_06885 [Verrucomicrobiota bacterium]